jgi:putative heme-binding domain-containing protein
VSRVVLLALAFLGQEPPPARDLAPLRKVVLDAAADRKAREEAAATLAADKDGANFLIALAAQGAFPKELEAAVAPAIAKNADFGVRALAGRYFKRPSRDGTFPSLEELAKMKGDPKNGRKVLAAPATGCLKCHRFGDDGGDVGPNLTDIREKYKRPELLDAILNPSAALAFGFETVLLRTKEDQVYSGIVLADGDEIVLKEASGEQRTILASRVASRKPLETSLMPDNLTLGLTAQELADVVELLLSGP